jgi:hypothetical protein
LTVATVSVNGKIALANIGTGDIKLYRHTGFIIDEYGLIAAVQYDRLGAMVVVYLAAPAV